MRLSLTLRIHEKRAADLQPFFYLGARKSSTLFNANLFNQIKGINEFNFEDERSIFWNTCTRLSL